MENSPFMAGLPPGLPQKVYDLCELHHWHVEDLQRMFYNEHFAPDLSLDLTSVPIEFWNEFTTYERYWEPKMQKAVSDNLPF